MSGIVIGKNLLNGFVGSYAEQGDHLVKTFPKTGDAQLDFGLPVFALNDANGAQGVAVAGATGLTPTLANFKGVAMAHVQSANTYLAPTLGSYPLAAAVPVMERGAVMVQCNNAAVNAPAKDGAVFVRIAAAATGKPIGGFEAAADSTNTVALTNCTWGTTVDSNGVAMLVIKSRNNS